MAGKVKRVERSSSSALDALHFGYGASGHRIMKQVTDDPDLGEGYREHYIRDAQCLSRPSGSNIMATYHYSNPAGPGVSLRVKEWPIYGSSRVGQYIRGTDMYGEDLLTPPTEYVVVTEPMHPGHTHYELNDHLGNVSAVVTGQLLPGGAASAWQPRLLSAQGYEPFGALLPGRNFSAANYRWGFNGAEKDDEVRGSTGTSYDFGARMLDVRVGRWLSLDPLARKFPDQSPYNFANDNPIYYLDPNGKTGITYLTVFDKHGNETKITLVDHNDVKSYDHYSHFWADGTTWTSKWDYSQTATLDFRNNPKGTFTVTSDPNLIQRVDWRASLARWIVTPSKVDGGMEMTSESGEGGAPPGFGHGRPVNIDGLLGMLGGASTTSKSKLTSVEDFVSLMGQWAETYNRTDAAFEKMGVKIELGESTETDKAKPAAPDPNDTICCGNGVLHLRKDSATHSNPFTPPPGKTVDDYKTDKK